MTALVSLWNMFQLRHANKKIEVVHKATNSMKDDLVSAVRKESYQKGQIDQASQQNSSKVKS